ncbi:MAG: restriction endonuclease [Anaerolineales bacterium]
MPIPDYQTLMLPLLKLTADKNDHSLREAVEVLAKQFQLSADELAELLPNGRKTRFYDRVGWAGTYLRKAGLLASSERGQFRITQRGLDVLNQKPVKIDVGFLEQYEEFIQFRTRRNKEQKRSESNLEAQTPEEVMDDAYQTWRKNLADEILEKIKQCSPAFFETLVVDVLVKMGYGGTRQDAGKAIGRSGDEGIDGIINEDRLGLDVIYIQAKKWDKGTPIGRPEIQKFAGALQGQRAKKGIFITTSTFTKDAYDFASKIDSKIVLIDGDGLSQLMIDFNVGVNLLASYELKRVDSDYFET